MSTGGQIPIRTHPDGEPQWNKKHHLSFRGTLAGSAKGMVDSVRCDHESTAAEGDRHFYRVRRKSVSKPCCPGYAAQTAEHHQENHSSTMLAKSSDQGNGSKESYEESQTTVYAFLGWQEMS
jgi:hypothetical protein